MNEQLTGQSVRLYLRGRTVDELQNWSSESVHANVLRPKTVNLRRQIEHERLGGVDARSELSLNRGGLPLLATPWRSAKEEVRSAGSSSRTTPSLQPHRLRRKA